MKAFAGHEWSAGSLRAPGIEQLQQLLARGVVVPGALLADDREKLVQRTVAIAFGVQRKREVEARLGVVGIGRKLGAE